MLLLYISSEIITLVFPPGACIAGQSNTSSLQISQSFWSLQETESYGSHIPEMIINYIMFSTLVFQNNTPRRKQIVSYSSLTYTSRRVTT